MSTKSFFAKWKDELPGVAASLTTALILFLAALMFKPVRDWFFPPAAIKDYPLICTAEPVLDKSSQKLIVEFFIINRTGEEYTNETLKRFLYTSGSGRESAPSPEIELKLQRKVGRIEGAHADDNFNRSKGEVTVIAEAEMVKISVRQIAERAILRVYIVLADLPDLGEVSRVTKSAVPFAYREYQDACYTR